MKRIQIIMAIVSLCALTACEEKKANTSANEPAAASAQTSDAKPAETTAAKPSDEVAESNPAPSTKEGVLGMGKTPSNIEPGATNFYGGTFKIESEPITLAKAIESAASNEGPYKVNAKIKKVCPKKGCWMTLYGDGVELPIRVQMKDYAFFVPMNASEMPAVVEGTLKKVTIPIKLAQHYADDEASVTGKPAKKVDAPVDSYEFTASAIKIAAPTKKI